MADTEQAVWFPVDFTNGTFVVVVRTIAEGVTPSLGLRSDPERAVFSPVGFSSRTVFTAVGIITLVFITTPSTTIKVTTSILLFIFDKIVPFIVVVFSFLLHRRSLYGLQSSSMLTFVKK